MQSKSLISAQIHIGKKFFIRSGAYTKALGIEEAIKYVATRFNT